MRLYGQARAITHVAIDPLPVSTMIFLYYRQLAVNVVNLQRNISGKTISVTLCQLMGYFYVNLWVKNVL